MTWDKPKKTELANISNKIIFLPLLDLTDRFLLGWTRQEINELLKLKNINDNGIPKKITRNKISSFNGAVVKLKNDNRGLATNGFPIRIPNNC